MPWAPGTACVCGGVKRHGRCDRCDRGKRARDTRKSAAERGYDWMWQRFRLRYLSDHPLCVDCLNPDPLSTANAFEPPGSRVSAATDVHHIQKLRDRPELKYEESNLMALCSKCHDRRTAKGE
jgi:5-methylcytosine-specific restriction protein A